MAVDYSELLRHPFWQKKRLTIMQRDGFACVECSDTLNNLQIHHNYYKADTMPWDYPDDCFKTLCDLCHKKAEFYKWMGKNGIAALIKLGLSFDDAHEVATMINRRVKENLYRPDVIQYIEDIKMQLNG